MVTNWKFDGHVGGVDLLLVKAANKKLVGSTTGLLINFIIEYFILSIKEPQIMPTTN